MSKLISRNKNIIKYKDPSQKIEQDIHLTDDDLMLMGWQRLYYDNDPNHRQVKDDDPLRKTLDESDWWVGDLLGNLVPKETVLHYWNTKNAPASNAILEKRWEDKANRLNLLEIEKELQRRKNKLFNKDVDTVFVKAPLALLGLGIGGAAALPYLVPGTIGGNIIGTTAFGEALNTAIKYGTGKTMGEHAVEAAHSLGIPQSLWGDFGIQMLGDMPLYVGGDLIGKAITNTGRTLGKEALNQIALNKSYFPTTKDLAKAINKEVKDKLFVNLVPGQIGWAPRQTLTGYHASNEPIQEFDYWFPNWAIREHNAPHGIYFTANETRPSGGFLAKRPYVEQVTSTFDKPMVQVGEISASAKNTTRNAIERQALSMGADGIIYQGIKDNQLKNQTIVKALNPDLRVTVSKIIENNPYLITKILDNEKIRLRLPTHTKDFPREIVLEPQGNNQYRIHIRTWNGDHIPANLEPKEKLALFESVYNELPEGAEILFPESSVDYPATRGTVAALTHLSRDPRFQRGNTTGMLIYTDKDGNLQTFTGNSFIKGKKPLDSHLLGEDAVRMFKEYGGEPIPESSINGEQLRKYVPEVRERYGLVGNTDVTDEEIAQALYKHVKELGGNTAAVNTLGEPLLLFRGDTKAYTELKERMSPEELSTKTGTMDNSLGNLFLGEFPFSYRGVDRYIGTWRNFNGSLELIGSGTGAKVIFDGKPASEIEGAPLIGPKFGGGYKLYSHPMRYGNVEVYKLPASMMEFGVNDLNAFVVRTPAVRDATPEISVLNDDWLVQGAKGSEPHMSTKLIYDKDGFPLYLHTDGTTTPALAGMDNRPGMAEHYRFVLDDAKNKGEGLLRSDKNAPLRDEHTLYTYFALPNFNIRGAKHILPYDLRIPRNWNDPNIYRSILPFILGGSTLYGVTSNRKGGKLIPRNKIGGKINIFDNGGLTSYKTEKQANEELKKYADRYKDFYYIELDKANVADVYKNYFGEVNVWLLPDTPSYEQALKENVERNKQLMDLYFNSEFEGGYIANGPEVSIEGTPHIQLVTYPIGGKKYPFTGHSELWGPDYFNISKGSGESDYNLFGWFGGRNCATETYDFLKEIFGNKFDPSTSAGGNWRPLDLPVNVEALALKLPGAKFKQEGEKRIISIPITSKYQNNYKTAVEKRKNKEYTK